MLVGTNLVIVVQSKYAELLFLTSVNTVKYLNRKIFCDLIKEKYMFNKIIQIKLDDLIHSEDIVFS